MIKTDLVSNLPNGMQERVNNAGSDMEKWLAEIDALAGKL